MRKTYKNQKEKLKGALHDMETMLANEQSKRRIAEEKIKVLQKQSTEPEKRISVIWFCKQCRVVAQGTIPVGVNIETCACLNCGAGQLLAVGKVKGTFFN